jgi:small neutral amino acid transporter SnatA (MarC family)
VGNCFCALFLLVNPLVIIFFYYQRIYRQTKNYRRSISVSDFVGKLITNGMIV